MEVSEKTLNQLETAKSKELLICGYPSYQIERDFNSLLEFKKTEVGYRAGCGKKDNTHLIFEQWQKIIKLLKKDGFLITEENVIHANKSPTMSGGFWNSIIYSIK